MTGIICVSTSHSLSRSYLNHLVNAKMFSYILYCLLFFKSTCFGHSCDHLQAVLEQKYKDYNRNYATHIKYKPKKYNLILPHLKETLTRFYNTFIIGHLPRTVQKNLELFYRAFYVTSVVLLVFLLWGTLKMVTEVTETCRCKE